MVDGAQVHKRVTIEEARQYLQGVMNERTYDVAEWNCHVAQETLRKYCSSEIFKDKDPGVFYILYCKFISE